jgi:hypothetical protein
LAGNAGIGGRARELQGRELAKIDEFGAAIPF